VVEFAKKTGDYASLSAVDMKVIALTRTFEREHNGADHLREAPLPPTLVVRLSAPLSLSVAQSVHNAQWRSAPLTHRCVVADDDRDTGEEQEDAGGEAAEQQCAVGR
jgi:hypothetical protein